MKVLIAYASTHGQTRKIAQFVMDLLFDTGQSCELLPLKEAKGINLDRFDRVILAASVHAGHYQKALSRFASRNSDALGQRPTLFLSVCLAAAGHDAEDWKGLDQIAADLTEATSWAPDRVEHVAGAYKPSEYDVVRRLIMRRIIAAKDPGVDVSADKEYTDWDNLAQVVSDWVGQKRDITMH